ncbi:hypothetical protein PV11_03274 [Exophiala sideris]|uniref:Uncharacterized protein n=1 Tax=Exophiala sideris TaxID=1016849 RepID=A0A0D1XHU1_9EURO|nr:hypothetical protein PV11_03274 [Exophiala sideris]
MEDGVFRDCKIRRSAGILGDQAVEALSRRKGLELSSNEDNGLPLAQAGLVHEALQARLTRSGAHVQLSCKLVHNHDVACDFVCNVLTNMVVVVDKQSEDVEDVGRLQPHVSLIHPRNLLLVCRFNSRRSGLQEHDTIDTVPILSVAGHDYLEVKINGVHLVAVLDNQATSNFMSLEIAEDLCCNIEGKPGRFLLGDGTFAQSRARTQAICTVLHTDSTSTCTFHLLDQLTMPLVLGKPFLRTLSRLRANHSTGLSCKHTLDATQDIGHSVGLKIRLRGKLGTRAVPAIFDMGSNSNLLPLSLIKQLGTCVNRDSGIKICLGDGSVTKIVGTAKVSFDICGSKPALPRFCTTFLVIANLPFTCVLGNPAMRLLTSLTESQLRPAWKCVTDHRELFCGIFRRTNSVEVEENRMLQNRHIQNQINQDESKAWIEKRREDRHNAERARQRAENEGRREWNLAMYERAVREGNDEAAAGWLSDLRDIDGEEEWQQSSLELAPSPMNGHPVMPALPLASSRIRVSQNSKSKHRLTPWRRHRSTDVTPVSSNETAGSSNRTPALRAFELDA